MKTTTKSYRDKKTRRDEIKNDLDNVLEQLAQATEDAKDHETYKAWLANLAQFHNYSWNNCILIGLQKPEATRVAGKTKWWDLGYKLKKGCTACWILAPLIKKDKETDESKVFGFRTVCVFDISDVEERIDQQWVDSGKSPADFNLAYRTEDNGNAAELLEEALEVFAASKGIEVEYVPAGKLGGANGCSAGGKIKINKDLQNGVRAGTLAHEIGHELLHWGEDRLEASHSQSFKEVEAESVSYAILLAHGIKQNSEFYLANWGGTKDLVKQSLGRIRGAVNEVLDFIAKHEPSGVVA